MKGRGVASHLMRRLIDWARARGLREIEGQVLADNAPMLAFVRRLGFSVRRMPRGAAMWWRHGCRWSRLSAMETSAVRLAGANLRAARRHAILYVLAASAIFTLGSALVKALTVDFPVLEIVMFRSVVGLRGDAADDHAATAGCPR